MYLGRCVETVPELFLAEMIVFTGHGGEVEADESGSLPLGQHNRQLPFGEVGVKQMPCGDPAPGTHLFGVARSPFRGRLHDGWIPGFVSGHLRNFARILQICRNPRPRGGNPWSGSGAPLGGDGAPRRADGAPGRADDTPRSVDAVPQRVNWHPWSADAAPRRGDGAPQSAGGAPRSADWKNAPEI